MNRLTKRTVDGLQPRDGDFFAWDSELKGFGVRVHPSARKTFLVQYRSKGRSRRVKVGVYGAITADQARKQAQQLLGRVAKGEDPAEMVAFDRRAPTLAEVAKRFLDEYVSVHCKPSTEGEYRRTIRLFVRPAFGTRKIGDITRADPRSSGRH